LWLAGGLTLTEDGRPVDPLKWWMQQQCGKPILKMQAPQDHKSHKNNRIKKPQKAPQILKQIQTTLKHWPDGQYYFPD
jgi:hypothetical protein